MEARKAQGRGKKKRRGEKERATEDVEKVKEEKIGEKNQEGWREGHRKPCLAVTDRPSEGASLPGRH